MRSRSIVCGLPSIWDCYRVNSFTTAQGLRKASSVSSPSSANDPYFHKEWPNHHNPSPYEVFNINPSEFDPKLLRKKYYQFAKIYHPDISGKKHIVSHKGDSLTDIHKKERFKLLTEAYTLLKDHKKRELYDRFRMGWSLEDQPMLRKTTYQNTKGTAAHAHAYDYSNYQYWNAGSWEDYQNLRDMNDPALRADKMKILAAMIALMIVSATAQGWMILDNVEKSIMENQRIHDKTDEDLRYAHINYGFDQSRVARLRRFLWFRTFGLYADKDSLDASHQENEKLLKKIFGDDYEQEKVA